MSSHQSYMKSPPQVSRPPSSSNGAPYPQECGNQFRGHPYPSSFSNTDYPPSELSVPNVAVVQPNHGQTLTLNQLLLQNNSTSPQHNRSSGSIPPINQSTGYHYDHYPYIQKPAPSNHLPDDRSKNSVSPAKEVFPATGLTPEGQTALRGSRASTPGGGPLSQPPNISEGTSVMPSTGYPQSVCEEQTASNSDLLKSVLPSSSPVSSGYSGAISSSSNCTTSERLENDSRISPSLRSGPQIPPQIGYGGPRPGYPPGYQDPHNMMMGGGYPGGYPPRGFYPQQRMGFSPQQQGSYSMMPPPPPPPGPMGYGGPPSGYPGEGQQQPTPPAYHNSQQPPSQKMGGEQGTNYPPGSRSVYMGGQGSGGYPVGDPNYPQRSGVGYPPMLNGVGHQRGPPGSSQQQRSCVPSSQERGGPGYPPFPHGDGQSLPPQLQSNPLQMHDPAFSGATRADSRDGSVSSRMSSSDQLPHEIMSPNANSGLGRLSQSPRPPSYTHHQGRSDTSMGTPLKSGLHSKPDGVLNSSAEMFMKDDRVSMSETQHQQYMQQMYRQRMPLQQGRPFSQQNPGGYPSGYPNYPPMPPQHPHHQQQQHFHQSGYSPQQQQQTPQQYPGGEMMQQQQQQPGGYSGYPPHPRMIPGAPYSQSMMQSSAPPPHLNSQSSSVFSRLMEMGCEPERRQWLEHYMFFMEEIGKPFTGLPQVVKQPLDLYRFYLAVRERGGVMEVIKTKRWKEISQIVNINASASAAYTLRKNYCKYLLDYECRFDRGAMDTRVILSQIEQMSGKKKKPSVGSIGGGSEMNESSASGTSSTPFPPPSPVGSQSSASSNLMAASGGMPGDSNGLFGGPMDGNSPKSVPSTSASPVSHCVPRAVSPYPTPYSSGSVGACLPTPPTSAVPPPPYNTAQPRDGGPPQYMTGGPSWRGPSRPPYPGSGAMSSNYPPQTPRMPIPGSYMADMSGRRSGDSSYPTGGQFPPAARGDGRPGSPGVHFNETPQKSIVPPPSIASTVHHHGNSATGSCSVYPPSPYTSPPQYPLQKPTTLQQSPFMNQNASYSGGPTAWSGCPPGCVTGQPPPNNGAPPSFTAHYPSSGGGPPEVYRQRPPPHQQQSPQPPPPPAPQRNPHHTSQQQQPSPSQQPPPPFHPAMHGYPVPSPHHPGIQQQQHQQQQQIAHGHAQGMLRSGLQHPNQLSMPVMQRPGYVTGYWTRMDTQLFPPGCVEATTVDAGSRRKRYRLKDLGNVNPAKVIMALRCGLSGETTWALNALNIMSREESSAFESCFSVSSQLTALVTTISDHLRHSLNELFPQHHFAASLELPARLDNNDSDNDNETRHSPTDLPPPLLHSAQKKRRRKSDLRGMFSHLFDPKKEMDDDDDEDEEEEKELEERLSPPNGLASLEQEMSRIASAKGISMTSLRSGLRRMLRNRLTWGKNGMLVKIEHKHVKPLLPQSVPAVAVTSLLERKRGRPSTNHSEPAVHQHHHHHQPAIDEQPRVVSSKPIVFSKLPVTLANNLNGPEACTNLRKLAVFTIDEILAKEEPRPPVLLPVGEETATDTHRRSISMRELFICGGADSTCYVLPHFSALSNNHFMDGETKKTVKSEPATVAPITTDVKSEDLEVSPAKRVRSSSTSSLTCPVLSPQSNVEQQRSDEPHAMDVEEKEEEDELNSHRLMTDSKGYCPLRARGEIIRLGDPALWPVDACSEMAEAYALRALCVSTVLRNLSFFPSSKRCMCSHKATLALIGRVLTIGHVHYDENSDWTQVEEAARFDARCAWWMPWIEELCENALVLLVNISGHLECINLHESIARPILEGILHWITCQTAVALDALPGHRLISPCRLALEALNRLCVNDANVDMLLATPSLAENGLLGQLFDKLASFLAIPEDQVTRELALSTMHYLAESSSSLFGQNSGPDSGGQSIPNNNSYGLSLLAQAKPCPISGLVAFIEAAEAKTRRVIDQYGVHALQEQPELMGTSLELVRRAGGLLERLASNPIGKSRFTPELELRLLSLATSRVLDATVAQLLSGALFNLPTPVGGEDRKMLMPELPSPGKVLELIKAPQSSPPVQVETEKETTQKNGTSTTTDLNSLLKDDDEEEEEVNTEIEKEEEQMEETKTVSQIMIKQDKTSAVTV